MAGIAKSVLLTSTLLALLAAAACGRGAPPPSELWVGTWVVSVEDTVGVAERMARRVGLTRTEESARQEGEAAGRIAQAMMGALHIQADGTWRGSSSSSEASEHRVAGTWHVEFGHLFLYEAERDGVPIPRGGTVTHVLARQGSMMWPIQRFVGDGIPMGGPEAALPRVIHRRVGGE